MISRIIDWEYSGYTIILHLDLKDKIVTVLGKIIANSCDNDNEITVKVLEASDFFKEGYVCTFSKKYIISYQQGPRLFKNYNEVTK